MLRGDRPHTFIRNIGKAEKMVQIVLIRPGSTDYDEESRIQGDLDVPLNETGQGEARQLAEAVRAIGLDAIYASPQEPAIETAKVIAETLNVKWKPLEKLANLDHGLWQGMAVEDVKTKQSKVYRQWQEQPRSVCPPGGEMLDEVEKRILTAVAKLQRKHKEGRIALVVPEPAASLVRHCVNGGAIGDLWKTVGTHGSWEILEGTQPALV